MLRVESMICIDIRGVSNQRSEKTRYLVDVSHLRVPSVSAPPCGLTHTSSALKTSTAACVPDLTPSHCSAFASFGRTKRWKTWSLASEVFPNNDEHCSSPSDPFGPSLPITATASGSLNPVVLSVLNGVEEHGPYPSSRRNPSLGEIRKTRHPICT